MDVRTPTQASTESAAAEPRRCVLVLGMHRSGTSALTRVLSIAGARLPANLLGAGIGNETGHWESLPLLEYNEKLLAEFGSAWDDWRTLDLARVPFQRLGQVKAQIAALLAAEYGDAPLIVVKEPRICRFVPLFVEALAEAGIEARCVLVFRNPLEVTASLQKRDGMARGHAGLLWLRHVLDVEAATRGRPRAILSYEALLADWKAAFAALTQRLGIVWPFEVDDIAGQVDGFLAPGQRHFSRSTEDVLLDSVTRHWVGEAYSSLLVLERNPASKPALAALDRIRRELDHATPVIRGLQEEWRVAHETRAGQLQAAVQAAEAKAEGLAAQLAAREADVARLTAALGEREAEVVRLTAANAAQHGADAALLAAAMQEREAAAARLAALQLQPQQGADWARLTAGLEEREAAVARLETALATSGRVNAARLAELERVNEALVAAQLDHAEQMTRLQSEKRQLEGSMVAILRSNTWRMTRPLRGAMRLARRAVAAMRSPRAKAP